MVDRSATYLIPGLPDDVSLLCMARVPRQCHHILRCVSRRWRALINSEEFISCRRKNGLQETWIYALCKDNNKTNCCYCFDPKVRCWKPLPLLPSCCRTRYGMSFESLGGKLYLLGGCSWNLDNIDEVYCYDTSLNAWKVAPPMPRARCYFVTATVGDTLYAIDGDAVNPSSALHSWDTYDSVSNTWVLREEPQIDPYIMKALVLDHEIYTIHVKQPGTHYAGVYNTISNTWNCNLTNGIEKCWSGPTVVVDDSIYTLDEDQGMRLSKLQDGQWIPMGRLSSLVTGIHCQLAVVGRKIFVIGNDLRMVVVDVDAAVGGGWMLVTSPPIPGFSNGLVVISCKTITI